MCIKPDCGKCEGCVGNLNSTCLHKDVCLFKVLRVWLCYRQHYSGVTLFRCLTCAAWPVARAVAGADVPQNIRIG